MNAWDALWQRRSIRRFTEEPIPEEQKDQLIRVALQAPSAADARPWHLVRIDDRSRLTRLADRMEHCDMLREATWGLLICGDPSLEKIPGFWPQDCAAATQNVLIGVTAFGLGAVWIGLHPVEVRERAVRKLLDIPEAVVPFSLVAAGHPGETLGFEDRYDAGKLHVDRW